MKKTLLTSALLCLLAACGAQDSADSACEAGARQPRLRGTGELKFFSWSH